MSGVFGCRCGMIVPPDRKKGNRLLVERRVNWQFPLFYRVVGCKLLQFQEYLLYLFGRFSVFGNQGQPDGGGQDQQSVQKGTDSDCDGQRLLSPVCPGEGGNYFRKEPVCVSRINQTVQAQQVQRRRQPPSRSRSGQQKNHIRAHGGKAFQRVVSRNGAGGRCRLTETGQVNRQA